MLTAAARETTLVVFCRRPVLGSGKRRLARELGDPVTLRLSELLLATTLEDVAAWPGRRVIAPAEPGDMRWAHSLPVPVDAVVPQPSGNLGARLASVDRTLRDQGHTRILYIGSDAPILKSADYLAACDAITTHDVVLGPALDGGVTCLGSRLAWPELASLPWGGETLHAALQATCEGAGLTVQNLPTRYDVDVTADLERLRTDLCGDTRPARHALYRVLDSLGYSGS